MAMKLCKSYIRKSKQNIKSYSMATLSSPSYRPPNNVTEGGMSSGISGERDIHDTSKVSASSSWVSTIKHWLTTWFSHPGAKYATGVIGLVILSSLLNKWYQEDYHSIDSKSAKKIRSLVEQATRWNAMAQQDTNPILQLTHCNYALCCAQMVRSLASDKDVARITGIDINDLLEYLQTCESYAIRNMGQQCPRVKVEGISSVGSGWVN